MTRDLTEPEMQAASRVLVNVLARRVCRIAAKACVAVQVAEHARLAYRNAPVDPKSLARYRKNLSRANKNILRQNERAIARMHA